MQYRKPKAEFDLIFPPIRRAASKVYERAGIETHDAIQESFKNQLADFGAHVEKETHVTYHVSELELEGRVDLVAGYYGNTWAIEIDRTVKIESITKLLESDADFSIQFFYTADIPTHLFNGIYIIGKNMVTNIDNTKIIYKKLNLESRKLGL